MSADDFTLRRELASIASGGLPMIESEVLATALRYCADHFAQNGRPEHGSPERIRELAEVFASGDVGAVAAQEALDLTRSGGGPRTFDVETGEPTNTVATLNAAVRSLGGTAEFVRVLQIGSQKARWRFAVRSRETREPVELESMTTKQLRNLSNLAERVLEARAGTVPTPRANSEKHEMLIDAITAVAEFEEHGGTELGAWRRRLVRFATVESGGGDLEVLDPTTAAGKAAAIREDRGIFETPEGRLAVHVPSWLEFQETRRLEADEGAMRAALKALGFAPGDQITARVGDDNRPRSRRYWLGDLDWRREDA